MTATAHNIRTHRPLQIDNSLDISSAYDCSEEMIPRHEAHDDGEKKATNLTGSVRRIRLNARSAEDACPMPVSLATGSVLAMARFCLSWSVTIRWR